MACPFVQNCGRFQVYATTKASGAQYYKIYSKLCNLLGKKSITCDIVSAGDSDSSTAVMITNCGGIIPLVKSSNLDYVTVSELPAGTSIDVVVKTTNSIPQGVVIGL